MAEIEENPNNFALWKSERLQVPNHLLETKVFSKVSKNTHFEAQPAELHFSGFEVGVPQTLQLNLMNISDSVQRLHIVPPQSQYFKLEYHKKERLVPGFAVECFITFIADESRYFYDSIRIHSKTEENLVVPLHAYPILSRDHIPEYIRFTNVPVGYKKSKLLPLRNESHVSFEFRIVVLREHETFTIEPLAGVVQPRDRSDIVITYAPTSFSTSHVELQIETSQYRSRPILVHLSGSSRPGIEREMAEQSMLEKLKLETAESASALALKRQLPSGPFTVGQSPNPEGDELTFLERATDDALQLDPERLNLLEVARERKALEKRRTGAKGKNGAHLKRSLRARIKLDESEIGEEAGEDTSSSLTSSTTEPHTTRMQSIFAQRFLQHKGYRIPVDLNNPTAVAFVLAQEPEKVKITELREVNFGSDSVEIIPATRQVKENLFEKELRNEIYNERQNRLRWMSKLGEKPMTFEAKRAALDFRTQASTYYRTLRLREPLLERELQRTQFRLTAERTVREIEEVPSANDALYNIFKNSITDFFFRKKMREKFVEAARSVIFRIRVSARLDRIRIFVRQVRELAASGQQVDIEALAQQSQKHEPALGVSHVGASPLVRNVDEDVEAAVGEPPVGVGAARQGAPPHPFTPRFTTRKVQLVTDTRVDERDSKPEEEEEKRPVPIPESFSEIVVRQRLPVLDFKVPQYYKQMVYTPYDTHVAEHAFTPLVCSHALRRGPEDQPGGVPEETRPKSTGPTARSPSPAGKPGKRGAPSRKQSKVSRGKGAKGAAEAPEPTPATATATAPAVAKRREPPPPAAAIDPLVTPPDQMFRPVEYPRLHVMNPAPGLQTYLPSVYYSEIDVERGLVPIATETMDMWAVRTLRSGAGGPGAPGKPTAAAEPERRPGQKEAKYVDHEDVVRGTQTWREFGRSSVAGSLPSLASFAQGSPSAQTRWGDRFSHEMLPVDGVPELLDALPDEDRENILPPEKLTETPLTLQLTPQVIATQFPGAREGTIMTARYGPRAGGGLEEEVTHAGGFDDQATFDRFGARIRDRESIMRKYALRKDLF